MFPATSCGRQLYAGHLVILTRLQALNDFVDYTREELTELFKPHDPEHVHEHIDPAEMAKMLGAWKPRFIHSERSRKLVRAIITEGGILGRRYTLRPAEAADVLPAGAPDDGCRLRLPWHRDTWYSAPAQQINWWLPIFPVRDDNAMSFDLASFDRAVPNTSGTFDYYQNNVGRLTTATGVTRDVQPRPGAIDHKPDQELVILPAPGEVLLFSGNQLHASTPNTSGRARFSVDFRTVDVPDLVASRGAALVDAHCTGTAIRDFINVADESSFDEQTVIELFGAPPADAMLVFGSPDSRRPDPGLVVSQPRCRPHMHARLRVAAGASQGGGMKPVPVGLGDLMLAEPSPCPRPGILLDRDGTIIVDHGHVGSIDRVEFIQGAAEAIARFNQAGIPVAVVTNQAGIARGLYGIDDVARVHQHIAEHLAKHGAHIDLFLYCPYHPAGVVEAFARTSEDRKPRPGMAKAAQAALNLDLTASWVVGDRPEDIGLAEAVGASAIYLGTGDCQRPGCLVVPEPWRPRPRSSWSACSMTSVYDLRTVTPPAGGSPVKFPLAQRTRARHRISMLTQRRCPGRPRPSSRRRSIVRQRFSMTPMYAAPGCSHAAMAAPPRSLTTCNATM